MEEHIPGWAIIELSIDNRCEYCGSARLASFATHSEAVGAFEALSEDIKYKCLIVEVRERWKYFLPDGRPFAPALGDWITKHL